MVASKTGRTTLLALPSNIRQVEIADTYKCRALHFWVIILTVKVNRPIGYFCKPFFLDCVACRRL